MQPLPASSRDAAAADTTGPFDALSETVDRVAEIRSPGDLWALLGDFQVEAVELAFKLLLAILVLIVFAVAYRVAAAALRPVFHRSRLEDDAAGLILAILKFAVLGLGAILALDQLGFDVTSLIAGLGIAGLALGFAAKDTLANVIAGFTILWDRPFRVGDRVEMDGEFGQVKRITLRSTRIHTNQNRVVIIPNQNVVTNKVVNHTMQASLRLDVPFGIAYKEDIDAARAAVLAIVAGDDRVRERPAPEVVVTELADSAIKLMLRVWLKNPHQEVPIDLELLESIKKALDGAGIEIPYPHLSLIVERLPEGTSEGKDPAARGEPGEEKG